ncbi:hypothetical protein [Spiroplasma endosymbiont of Lasioglossum malachurum]|uniref:hypothetical protein n=1 Tax=Spiroplasma endosymbiont of Lasioglossum malachurum TaxID=3066319 RepID=UPI0030CD65E1
MKNLKSILSIVGVLGFTAITTSNVTACISNITSNFQEITNWKENNGEIQSLVNNKILFMQEPKLAMAKVIYLKYWWWYNNSTI